jgi:hypothetical protein
MTPNTPNTPRCRCGRPAPDAHLCRGCTDQLRTDLAALASYLPGLTRVLARQQRTTDNRSRRPTRQDASTVPAPETRTRKLTASESSVSLVATPLQFDPAASDLLAQARSTLGTWCRYLCAARGIPIERVLEAA